MTHFDKEYEGWNPNLYQTKTNPPPSSTPRQIRLARENAQAWREVEDKTHEMNEAAKVYTKLRDERRNLLKRAQKADYDLLEACEWGRTLTQVLKDAGINE